jgi:hypothetical protein
MRLPYCLRRRWAAGQKRVILEGACPAGRFWSGKYFRTVRPLLLRGAGAHFVSESHHSLTRSRSMIRIQGIVTSTS